MKSRPLCRSESEAGFTLVELLIAIAILGLLMTAAFGSLTLGSRSWELGISKADANQDLRTSIDFVKRQFAHLVPISRNVDGQDRIVFTGEPDVARFVAPAPESLGSGLIVLTLALERQAADVNVWFSIAPFDPGEPSQQSVREAWQRSLFAELADASISYFGAPTEMDENAWRTSWQRDATRFPGVVRLAGITGDGAQQFELFFRVKAEELL
jgi:general secretion pathway protein J